MNKIDHQSHNFNFAKVVSILMVVFGHYYERLEIFWVPITIGLFIFAYSSGYFTSFKYKRGFETKAFWKSKFKRIGITLLIVDIFLLILFVVQRRPNIFHWDSIINLLGLTGVLNWFSLPSHSPFGAGLWFLTLLYIFYTTYPLIKKISYNKYAFIFAIGFSLLMWFLNIQKPMGHSLWLTATAFIWGVFINTNKKVPNLFISLIILAGSFIAMVVTNFFLSIKLFNFPLILCFALFSCLLLEEVKIPKLLTDPASFFKGTIFYIYLLHSYVFLDLFLSNLVNTLISILFVCVLGKTCEIFQNQLSFRVKKMMNS